LLLHRRKWLIHLCAGAAAWPRIAQAKDSVTVFAAVSLSDVLQAWAARSADAGVRLRFSFAASSTLARQIEQGAPADLFISADEAWMEHLAARGLINVGSRRVLATNRLVVVRSGPAVDGEPPESVGALRDALLGGDRDGRIATGDPAHVPVGRYAQAALQRLGLWEAVQRRLVRTDNVRSALAFVERSEAVAGIVYATDARVARRLRVVARFPQDSHPAITYPAALLRGASPAAHEVWKRLFGTQTRDLLREAGFGIEGGPRG
jgi:molybdate transport system substrate-binding protein